MLGSLLEESHISPNVELRILNPRFFEDWSTSSRLLFRQARTEQY